MEEDGRHPHRKGAALRDALAHDVADDVEAEGVAVAGYPNLCVTDNREVGRIPADLVSETAATLDVRDCDAEAISGCVRMPPMDTPGPAARMFDVPVLSASPCTARCLWRAMVRPE